MPLAGLIGLIIVANPDICAQLLPLEKKKEPKHKFLETLPVRNLPSDGFCIPKKSQRERGCTGENPLG